MATLAVGPAIRGFKPHPKQEEFLSAPPSISEVLYGGAAGGGKSECLLWFPIVKEYYKHPRFKAIIFRREFPRLEASLIARSQEIYAPLFSARYNDQKHVWIFPSGARVYFGHLEQIKDVYKYDSAEYHLIMFDELTEFEEFQYRYLSHRARTVNPELPAFMRSTATPGNIGHTWVRKMFIEPHPEGGVKIEEKNPRGSIKRLFIKSLPTDNPSLLENDPTYLTRMYNLPEAERKAKMEGDWWTFSGQVFTEFRTVRYPDEPENAYHLIEPFEIPDWWPKVLALDWGYTAQTYALGLAISPWECVFAYREYTKTKEAPKIWGAEIANIWRFDGNIVCVTMDPSANQHRDSPRSIKDQFIEGSGFRDVIDADNDRISGKLLVNQYLRWKPQLGTPIPTEGFDPELFEKLSRNSGVNVAEDYRKLFLPKIEDTNLPKLKIFTTCPILIDTIPRCIYDDRPRHKEDVKGFDGDDPYDTLRYGLKQVHRFVKESEKQWKEVVKMEKILNRLETSGDMTTYYRQMENYERSSKDQISVRRYRKPNGGRITASRSRGFN